MSIFNRTVMSPSILFNKVKNRIGRIPRQFPLMVMAVAFLALPAGSSLFSLASSSTTSTIQIINVVVDNSVTVRTSNFPANTTFTATMGPMGTQGINGYVVGTLNSASGGSMDATFSIPSQLKGAYQISIRLQSGGMFPYFAYNWFFNNSSGPTAPPDQPPTQQPPTSPGYSGNPTFKITAVKKNTSVTIETANYPANQTFSVTMGPMGSKGVNGYVVGTLESGSGGTLTASYNIPAELKDHAQIAIRTQTAHAQPFYAYNWFWNNDTNGASAGTGGQPETSQPESGTGTTAYTGIPVMKITAVKRNESVTFETANYPPNQTFTVTMGPMGTRAIGGYVVGTFNSGQGGTLSVTMPIPTEMANSYQIAVRAQTAHAYPFYSYNWFYNNSTS